jgi:hypothetical protein
MVVRFAVIVVLLGACVADDEASKVEVLPDDEVVTDDQVCEAASALPASDVCSLVCDPDAFRARLADEGMKSGACYAYVCTLAPEMSVTVGVCLP